jgi:hypothetical protein
LAAFRVAGLPVCPFAKSTIHFVSVHLKAIGAKNITWCFFNLILFDGLKTKWIIDLANGQTGKPATRKAANNYQSRSIPSSFLEPSLRSWSHFVRIYRQKLTRSSKN